MDRSILKIVKWFCRQLTFNELASAVVIFLEVLNSSRSDISLKPEDKPKYYREFRVDTIPPLPTEVVQETDDWEAIKAEKEQLSGKPIKPVRHRNGGKPPDGCRCHQCNAPTRYLYLNNGQLKSQVRCKICGKTSPTHDTKRQRKTKYRCPHCSNALYKWKRREHTTIYKCPNDKCPHYLHNKRQLPDEATQMRESQKYDPNFKLRYQYREYHISPQDLRTERPIKTTVNLKNIHHSYHTLGLVLVFTINLGLSSRTTRDALKGIFDIELSHQTVLNYVEAAAGFLSPFIDANSPPPQNTCAADETYIIVKGKWIYTWFVIDSETRAICGYNLSEHRDTIPALSLLHDCFGKPQKDKTYPELITDGNPSYDSAVMAYNAFIENEEEGLAKKTVIGLKNLDEESSEYRRFKQLIERLNRTYKFHTRPRYGFKSFDGAVALTTLFVAYYNFMRPHSSRYDRPPISLTPLEEHSLMPDKWVSLLEQAAA
jgi:transposase-like protein